MTLWVRKFGLILGLAFFIFACGDPGEIGLDLNPENGAFYAKFNDVKVLSTVIQQEDIVSDNSTRINETTQSPSSGGRLLIGAYSTQDFGKFTSKGFSSLYLGSANFGPEGFVYDSLVLRVKVDYLYGPNFEGNKRISVHELSQEILLDSLYLTKNSTPYIDQAVGEMNFDVSSLVDSARIDTVYSVRLSDELGQRFFDKALSDTTTYNNNLEFRKFFNGFAFVPDESNEVLAGIYVESQETFIRMYLHDATDTTYFDYIFQGYDPDGLNITRYYNNTSLDKTGSAIEGIPDYYKDFDTDNEFSYIQASSGVLTKLDFTSYLNFIDTIDHLIINRAEMVIPVNYYDDKVTPSASLSLYIADDNNRFVVNYDSANVKFSYPTVGGLSFEKETNENKGRYYGVITNYIQDLTSGNSVYGTNILLGQPNLSNSVVSVNQSIVIKDEMYINVYYSTLQ